CARDDYWGRGHDYW
nr:immunoglobulin heavy chain junction region [Macaca mulatta]